MLMACGVAIAPQQVTSLADDVQCPRCQASLRSRRVDPTIQVVECSGCGGSSLARPPRQPLTEKILEFVRRGGLAAAQRDVLPILRHP